MPAQLTYPGVYIEEIPSGVRTITGVATSVTAFIGRARKGPLSEPKTINSFGDFERIFGGLWKESTLGFAVRDFFLNGGNQAIIVRIFHPTYARDSDRAEAIVAAQDAAQDVVTATAGATAAEAASSALAQARQPENSADPRKTAAYIVAKAAKLEANKDGATVAQVQASATAAVPEAVGQAAPLPKAKLEANGLNLVAANEGSWGNNLRVRIDHDVKGDDSEILFNLSVLWTSDDIPPIRQFEFFRNVSVVTGHPRQLDNVLKNESNLVRVDGALPTTRPTAHAVLQYGQDVWKDYTPATNSRVVEDKASDGSLLQDNDFIGENMEEAKTGLYALRKVDLFNILCIPPYKDNTDVSTSLIDRAIKYCEDHRAMLLIDPPSSWIDKDRAKEGIESSVGAVSKNAALFFPRLRQPNPFNDNQKEDFAPCGAIAGIFARTDTKRGVWKAPAGLEATLVGVPELSVPLTDNENGELNQLGINCLRAMPAVGRVVWGTRTREGDDRLASEWKYIPVRRTALFIEESLFRGTKWVVFEPNDEPLWAQIRLNIGAFMHNLFRQGAFQGSTPREAYFVKCDKETTTQNDINLGIVNIVVGFAPLKPAEFVVIKLQQMAGQIQT